VGVKAARRLATGLFGTLVWLIAAAPAGASCPLLHTIETYEPSWSPDGTKIAFVRASDIWVANSDGSGQINLTNDPFGERSSPAWSPDGARIAFDSEGEIWVMNAGGGGGETRLTSLGGHDPTWSPDGRQLAFESRRNGSETYVMNADGSMQIPIVRTQRSVSEDPSWSPDGTRIAFVSYEGANADVYSVRPDGSDRTRLTDDPAHDSDPAWSPDGTRLAWLRGPTRYRAAVHVKSLSGGGETRISPDSASDFEPAWSANGRIAFGALHRGSELRVVGAGGESPQTLDVAPSPRRRLLGSEMSIEISPSTSAVEYGQPVALAGDVLVRNAGCSFESLVDTRVVVSAKAFGEETFRVVAELKNPNGGWRAAHVPQIQTTYEARIGRRLAAETVVLVRPRVVLARLRKPGFLQATVSSLHSYEGRVALVQRRGRGGVWRTFRRLILGARSSATFRAPRGRTVLRVYVSAAEAGPGYVTGISAPLVVRR
jgi:dipeptidyl aminopeptidase/acylaminoacyl peptidase